MLRGGKRRHWRRRAPGARTSHSSLKRWVSLQRRYPLPRRLRRQTRSRRATRRRRGVLLRTRHRLPSSCLSPRRRRGRLRAACSHPAAQAHQAVRPQAHGSKAYSRLARRSRLPPFRASPRPHHAHAPHGSKLQAGLSAREASRPPGNGGLPRRVSPRLGLLRMS